MKNIKIIGLLTVGSLFFSSCERDLEQVSPMKVQSDLAFSNVSSFQGAVDAAYDAMKNSGYFSGDTSLLGVSEEMTDNLVINPQGRQTNYLASNWNLSSTTSSVTNLFIQGYLAISYANLPLKYIDKLPDGADKQNIISQARAIRAMVHFDLVRAYCKIPTQSADAGGSVGLDYVTEYNTSGTSGGRTLTVNQVYDKILEDLNYAAENLTIASPDKGRLTKAAVLGLLSRVYLYKGDYANAIKTGQQSIALSSSVGSLSNFPAVWSSNNVDGVLFKILNSSTEGVTTGVVFQQGATATGGSIKSEYVVPKSVYDLFKDTDIRKTSYMRQSAYSSNGLRNHVIKYATNTAGGTPLNVTEIKYLRTAEVYLNVAEAAYKSGDAAIANTLLNTLKRNRYTGYKDQNLSGDALLQEILLQRRLELAFEVDRYYTLKRLGLPMQRTNEGAAIDGSGVPAVTQRIEAGNNKWQWPIPQSSIDKDHNIVQNPGY